MVIGLAGNKLELRVCSLFSGCGGLDIGLAGGFEFLGVRYPKTGIRTVFWADKDPDAVTTIKRNRRYFGEDLDNSVHLLDLTEFKDYSIVPPFDILAAGFPCQPFSNAGKRGGVNDAHGRGTLFEACEELIKALDPDKRPLAYIYENVKGILSCKMSDGTTVPDEISNRMKALGYNCSGAFLVHSQVYGVPQQRHRVLIVGLRKDLGVCFDYHRLKNYVKHESLNKLRVKDAIAHTEGLPNSEEIWGFSPQAREMIPLIKRSWKDIPYEKLPERFKRIQDNIKRYRAPNFYRRFGWEEINGTITASAQPENCGILHPSENRRYSVREVARIQSFPDDFKFEASTLPGKYKLIGNAVPPILGYVIGQALKNTIEEVLDGQISHERSG